LVEKHDKDFTAKLLVKNCPENVEIAKKVIKHFSNDSYYEFAHKLLREMDLNFKEFPELNKIMACRNKIVDMAFLEPTDSRFVPLHAMEDLITGNQKLLVKFYNRMMREKMI
jgi:hypothetical protein